MSGEGQPDCFSKGAANLFLAPCSKATNDKFFPLGVNFAWVRVCFLQKRLFLDFSETPDPTGYLCSFVFFSGILSGSFFSSLLPSGTGKRGSIRSPGSKDSREGGMLTAGGHVGREGTTNVKQRLRRHRMNCGFPLLQSLFWKCF